MVRPRPGAAPAEGDPELARIVRVAVHPSVAIARVGNSPDSFFFGPELPGTLPVAPDGFKDANGAIARQAARFRVYGYDAAGAVVRELTVADGAAIAWTVSVANKKAAWYDFNRAMDIPVAAPVGRRNHSVTGVDRDRLVVASGERTISGAGAAPVPLDAGRFLDEAVPLGELVTDEAGRLVYLPADGRGYSPGQAPLTTFSDNDGWADDTCDGPVLATVTIEGRTLVADPGWVVVTPPNYGPGLVAGLVTGYDSARLGWQTIDPAALTAEDVSFRDDVLPIFRRIVDMQWVNAGFLGSNGWGSDADYLEPALLDRLADASAAGAALRQQTFDLFRKPDDATQQPDAVPQIYGDGVDFPTRSADQWLTVTAVQYAHLTAWAAGTFTDDRAEAATGRSGRAAAGRASDRPRPGRPGFVPRWRLPPGHRGAVDAARAVDVGRPGAAEGALDDGREPGLRRPAHARADHGRRRAAGRERSRRPVALAGHAVAERRGELPIGLRPQHLAGAAHVLAGAHPQPRAA